MVDGGSDDRRPRVGKSEACHEREDAGGRMPSWAAVFQIIVVVSLLGAILIGGHARGPGEPNAAPTATEQALGDDQVAPAPRPGRVQARLP